MLCAAVDPKTLGLNLYLIIGAVLVAAFFLIAVIAAWTGLKVCVWRRSVRNAEAAERRARLDPTGIPYPPAGRGLCDACQQVHDTVYHLPDGGRYCARCYAQRTKESL